VRIVPQALTRPHHCAMFPTLGARHRKGYFDTNSELPGFDNHAYVSVEFVEQAALHLGWVSPEEAEALRDHVEQLERRCAQLQDEVDDLNRDFEAIDVLASKGFTARKKPGRRPAAKEEV
jgi:hypothetical protein